MTAVIQHATQASLTVDGKNGLRSAFEDHRKIDFTDIGFDVQYFDGDNFIFVIIVYNHTLFFFFTFNNFFIRKPQINTIGFFIVQDFHLQPFFRIFLSK